MVEAGLPLTRATARGAYVAGHLEGFQPGRRRPGVLTYQQLISY